MTSDGAVQGFVLAVGFDGSWATVTDVTVAGTATAAAGADFVVPEIFADGFTLGVVVDSTGKTGSTIPAGTNVIAKFAIEADKRPAAGDPAHVVDLVFVDGVLNVPVLSNIIVIAGRSIGAGEGLGLVAGSFEIPPPPPATLRVEGGRDICKADAKILLDSPTEVQGFVLSLEHDASAKLDGIALGTVTEAVGAEFVVSRVYPDGGTLGVVLDFDPPYLGQVIPAGDGLHIATYSYVAVDCPACPADDVVAGVRFVDGKFGSPPLENVLVVAGLSVAPETVDGQVAFACKRVGLLHFYAGAQKPDGTIGCATAVPGGTAEVGFFYTSLPSAELTGMIQGLSLAVTWPCAKASAIPDGFSIAGTITETLGAEFVTWHVDNAEGDGDGCELVVGILLDSIPPFEDQRYPVTLDGKPLEIGRMAFSVAPDAGCDVEFPIEFRNGINGAGTVPISNRASIDNRSIPAQLHDGCIFVARKDGEFIRGDCNWDTLVDIADPAATINYLFIDDWQTKFYPPCKDACDANDDGRLDLADSVMELRYLFQFGPPPPAPGPLLAGPDPTRDKLDCKASEVCR